VGIELPSLIKTRKLFIPHSGEKLQNRHKRRTYVHGGYTDLFVGVCLMRSPRTMAAFAEPSRIRVTRDGCGDPIIRGKLGHLYEHDAGRFGIVLESPAGNGRSDKTIRARARRAVAAGLLVRQEGDPEAILLFDAANLKQADLAIRLIHAKKIRQAASPTDAQLRARALFSSKTRPGRPCIDQSTSAVVGQGG
jgi:hypothetical protein